MGFGVMVIGTDTDVGKTQVAVSLVAALAAEGVRVSGFKPVGSGAIRGPDGVLRHPDAERLLAVSTPGTAADLLNPYAFEPAIAPHLAAGRAGVRIDLERLRAAASQLLADHDVVVGEGAGGWCVPLASGLDTVDLVRALGWPCVLVVGLRLGCLNHARLTVRALQDDAVPWLGWIGNAIDADYASDPGNIEALDHYLPGPRLALVPRLAEGRIAVAALAPLASTLLRGFLHR